MKIHVLFLFSFKMFDALLVVMMTKMIKYFTEEQADYYDSIELILLSLVFVAHLMNNENKKDIIVENHYIYVDNETDDNKDESENEVESCEAEGCEAEENESEIEEENEIESCETEGCEAEENESCEENCDY